jgi:hypothetical protein
MLILLAIGAVWVTGVTCLIIDSWVEAQLNNWPVSDTQAPTDLFDDHENDQDDIQYEHDPLIDDLFDNKEKEIDKIPEIEDEIIDIDDVYIDFDTYNMEIDEVSGEIIETPIEISDIFLDNIELDTDGSVIDIDLENI